MRPIAIIILALLPLAGSSSTHVYSPAELTQRALMSMVKVEMAGPDDANGKPQSHYCAGFVVDAAKGWALTATHCVPEDFDEPVYVDGKQTVVIAANRTLALVKVPSMDRAPVELAKGLPPLGTRAIAVGYGLNEHTVVVRTVMANHGGDVFLDGYLVPGMSGGQLVDEQGRVIGILQAVWSPVPDAPIPVGIACGAEEIRAFLAAVAKQGR